jgi:PAS domain S-box-containing protein
MYCQMVMARRERLYVPDARAHEDWGKWEWSPDVGLGMTCYLGYPVLWPDGEVFGTICVMDRRENPEVVRYQDLVREFCRVVQDDLKLLVAMDELGSAQAGLERRVAERTAELRDTVEVLRLAQQAALAGVWNYDIGTGRETWSEECYRLFGVDPSTPVTYTSWVDLAVPEDRERVRRAAAEGLERHADMRIEFRIDHPRRGRRWMSCVGRTFYDQAGRPARVCGFKMDVTDRRRAEEETRRANAKVREVLESVTDAFSALDREWRFTYVNAQVARNVGKTREELVGRSIWELFPEEVGGEGYAKLQRAMEAREPVQYEYYVAALGRWFDNHVYPTEEGVALYSSDITQRKRAEEELRRANARVSEILESITDVFVAFDREWRYTYVNEHAATFLRVGRGELIGRSLWEVMPELWDSGQGRLLRRAMERREPVEYERYIRRLGRWVETHAYPTREGMSFYARDVTGRKRAERAIKRAKAAADAANRAKDQFIAVLSHELRTPLTPVLAAVSEWERRTDVPEGLREDLRLLRRNVELEARLVDDLLDSTRLTRGKVELHREVTDVHDCVRRALETCRAEARRKGVALESDLRAKDHHASVDGARVQQVFWNLVNNAIKFTPAGGRVRVTSDNEGGRLRVRVEDTGIGIEPGTLPRLFRPFEQGEQTKWRRFGGLGLGLTIAKSLVELHEGRLTAESEGRGKGAVFTVELGTVGAEKKEVAAAPPPAAAVGASEAGSWHVLLVEDDPDTMRVMARLLRRMGYVVESADSVRAALELAAREHYDLLISDLGLPDGSGLDVMREIRRRYGLKGLAISGYGTDEDVRESREAGFQQLLTKPVTVGTLESAVREMTAAH